LAQHDESGLLIDPGDELRVADAVSDRLDHSITRQAAALGPGSVRRKLAA
jgi:hypothetical protein